MSLNKPFVLSVLFLTVVWQVCVADDPLHSPMWDYLHGKYFPDAKQVSHSNDIQVFTPKFAENPLHVPVSVDVSNINNVEKIYILADLNPIQKILEYSPGSDFRPYISFYFKIQQRSPLRVVVKTTDGRWLMNGNWIEAVGGGCTVPSFGYDNTDWEKVGRVKSVLVGSAVEGQKMKMTIVHPMDTGLVQGIPAFYVSRITFREADNVTPLAGLSLFQPISQDPLIYLQLKPGRTPKQIDITVRDSAGQEFFGRTYQAAVPL